MVKPRANSPRWRVWDRRLKFSLLIPGAFVVCAAAAAPAAEFRGAQFLDFKSLSSFNRSAGQNEGEWIYTSPQILAGVPWTELIVSWNMEPVEGSYLKVEARAIYPDRPTKYFTMGLWSLNPQRHPRESVRNQKDADGDVLTDTLRLSRPSDRVQIRLTLGRDASEKARLKLIGLCLLDATARLEPLGPNRAAWGKVLAVPERSQMAYPNGNVLCSPTTVSMLMSYWAIRLKKPELDLDVPEIVPRLYDPVWEGTGNWPFNTAYAGSFDGMRAYVTRLTDVSELEDWIASGIPVGLSVCYNKLRGKSGPLSGHLVVCTGFTPDGDVILNDPGTRLNVRKTFPRKNLVSAWAYSRNAVYLIYPQSVEVPKDRFGHWDSWTSRQRTRFAD
jgi:hypothetical protein